MKSQPTELKFTQGQSIEYRWTKNGKWHKGRISKVEVIPGMISHYQVQAFGKCKVLRWNIIVEGIERGKETNFIDTQGEDIWEITEDWYLVKWFSENYLRDAQE